jgi:hypothetical protein
VPSPDTVPPFANPGDVNREANAVVSTRKLWPSLRSELLAKMKSIPRSEVMFPLRQETTSATARKVIPIAMRRL